MAHADPTPLMPHATAAWLVDNTGLTFAQIAEYCGIHVLEVQAIADETAGTRYTGRDRDAAGEDREPDVVIEEITGAGEEVTGPEAQAFLARRRYLRETSDAELLDKRLSVTPSAALYSSLKALLGPGCLL